jgi:hypothetical protein
MPMIEFRYDRNVITDEQAGRMLDHLEVGLRAAIRPVRPEKKDKYGIFIEGDPFGPVTWNQPGLRIYVFYHEGWEFTEEELQRVANTMRTRVDEMLEILDLSDRKSVIRFYRRSGHASA